MVVPPRSSSNFPFNIVGRQAPGDGAAQAVDPLIRHLHPRPHERVQDATDGAQLAKAGEDQGDAVAHALIDRQLHGSGQRVIVQPHGQAQGQFAALGLPRVASC